MEAQRPDSSIDIVLDQCFPDEREKTIRPTDFDYLLETEDDDETLSDAAVADIDNIVKETVAAVANIDGFIKESTDILPLDGRGVVIDFDDFVTATVDTATNNDGSDIAAAAAAAAAVVDIDATKKKNIIDFETTITDDMESATNNDGSDIAAAVDETTATKKKNILDFETTITDDNNQMESPVDTATNSDGPAAAAVVDIDETTANTKNIIDFETTIIDDNNQMDIATNNDGSAAAAAAVVDIDATTKNILDFETTIVDDNNQMDTATNNDGSAAAATVVETTAATKKKNILDFGDFESTIVDDNNQMDTATNNDGSASANARVNIPAIQTITTEENFFNFYVTPNQSSSTFTVETVEEQQYIMHTLDSAVDVSGCFSNESYIILNPALPVATDMEVTTSSADASDSDIISKNTTTTTIKTTCEYKQFIHYGVAELPYVRKLCYKNLHLRSPRSHTIPMALSADDLKSISTDLDKNNDGNFVLGYNDFISKADNAIFETAKFNIPIMGAAAAAAAPISFNFPDVIASLRRENVEMKGTYSFNDEECFDCGCLASMIKPNLDDNNFEMISIKFLVDRILEKKCIQKFTFTHNGNACRLVANLSQLGIVELSCCNSEIDQVVYPVRRGFVPEFMREQAVVILEELVTADDTKLYPGLVEILCYIAWKYSSTDLTVHYSNDPNNESTKYFALKRLLHQAIHDCGASYVHKYKMCTLAENHELFKDLSVKCMHFIRTYVENNPAQYDYFKDFLISARLWVNIPSHFLQLLQLVWDDAIEDLCRSFNLVSYVHFSEEYATEFLYRYKKKYRNSSKSSRNCKRCTFYLRSV